MNITSHKNKNKIIELNFDKLFANGSHEITEHIDENTKFNSCGS